MVAKVLKRGKLSLAETAEALARASKREHLLYQVLRDFIEQRPYTMTEPIATPTGWGYASIHQPLSPTGGYIVVIDKTIGERGPEEKIAQVEYLEDWISSIALMLRGMSFSDPDREPLSLLWAAVKRVQGMALDKEKRDRELGEARG